MNIKVLLIALGLSGSQLSLAIVMPFSLSFKYDGPTNADGEAHGKGVATFLNGDTYTGDFVNNEATGKGKYHSGGSYENDPQAYDYSGGFHQGIFHGQGTITVKNGFRYSGNFVNGAFQGEGKVHYAEQGRDCEGHFEKSQLHGKAVCKTENTRYHGEYKNGAMSGLGTIKYSNGIWFEGNFQNDMINGQGTLHLVDGTSITGTFIEDHFVNEVIMDFADGRHYEGYIDNYMASGKGKLVVPNQYEYQGEFFANQPDGKGTITFHKDGNIISFTGNFSNGLPVGEGICGQAPCRYTAEGFQLIEK